MQLSKNVLTYIRNAITGLGKTEEDYELELLKHFAEAILSNDPILIARAMGYDLPEGTELPQELAEKLQQIQQYVSENIEQAKAVAQMPQTKLAAGADESTWLAMRQALEATGLIQTERLPGVTTPYLRFHPTLAPVLRSRLTAAEQTELTNRYRRQYYQLSEDLYEQDDTNPVAARAVAKGELPNLLAAVRGALDAGEEWAVNFVDKVNWFLNFFGLNKDRAALTQRAQQLGQPGSNAWYIARSNVGKQLLNASRYTEAEQVFNEILAGLDEEASFERCNTLTRLGRCFWRQGRAAQAVEIYRQAIAEAEQLPASDSVKRQIGATQSDLGTVLSDMGDYDEARIAYQKSLALKKEIGDARGEAVTNGQLGYLALYQGKLAEAAKSYQSALKQFQGLKEPASEAIAWHQLGLVYQKAQQWEAAEQAYREAARIKESQGNLAGAVRTWNQLARVNEDAGKLKAAEAWYHKAIEGAKAAGDKLQISRSLSNLANLLLMLNQDRLSEARQLAEEGLAIKKTLDPAASEIWKSYHILANIADKQGDTDQAKEYRRLSRQEYAQFAGMTYQLQQYEDLIATVVAAVDNGSVRQQLEAEIEQMPEVSNLIVAIRAILQGERNAEVLCEPLDYRDGAIISAILRRIEER